MNSQNAKTHSKTKHNVEGKFVEYPLSAKFHIRFSVGEAVRFCSHMDIMRMFHRSASRANIPVRLTQGFSPKPRMAFPAPKSVGVVVERDVLELELYEEWTATQVKDAWSECLPCGFEIISVEPVGRVRKGALVNSATYRITGDLQITQADVSSVLKSETLKVVRKKGEVNIREYITSLEYKNNVLRVVFKVTPQGTARVDELLHCLGLSPESVVSQNIVREDVVLS